MLPVLQKAQSVSPGITSSTAQVTQVSLFTGLLKIFWLSVLLYCISNFLSKVQPFPLASYLIFQRISTTLSGETSYWSRPCSLSSAAFLPVEDGQVLSDTPQSHRKQENFCPAEDENRYLSWHLTQLQSMILEGGGGYSYWVSNEGRLRQDLMLTSHGDNTAGFLRKHLI